MKEEMIDVLDNHFTDQINYYKELQESLGELRGMKMPKAVLVMDMPESCKKCVFCRGLNACKLKNIWQEIEYALFTPWISRLWKVESQIGVRSGNCRRRCRISNTDTKMLRKVLFGQDGTPA